TAPGAVESTSPSRTPATASGITSGHVGAQHVASHAETADDELVAALERAVLVLDDHGPVVAHGVERAEEAVPPNLPEPRQSWHLPVHAEGHHAVLVETVRAYLEVLRVHVQDAVPELVYREILVHHI